MTAESRPFASPPEPAAPRDALAGLGNRDQFEQQLRSLIAHTCREHDRLAVVFIDFRGLDPIRQRHGDRAGNAAVIEFARRIRSSARRVDVCARLEDGGFAVILPQIADRAVALRVQDRFRESVAAPFEFEGTHVEFGARCGVAIFPDDAQDAEALLATAIASPQT